MIKLPAEKTEGAYQLNNIRLLLYGMPKIGKSTFCSKFDDALFLATEKGLKGLNVYQTEITNWDEFKETVTLLNKPQDRFKTIIIDTVDNLFKFCLNEVCRKNKIEHPSDAKWGKGWDLLQREFERQIIQLSLTDYGIIFISHTKEMEIVGKYAKYTKIGPSLHNQARKILIPFVDSIGYCTMDTKKESLNGQENLKERRVIKFEPSEYYEAGDRTGLLPGQIQLNYHVFKNCFKKSKIKNSM